MNRKHKGIALKDIVKEITPEERAFADWKFREKKLLGIETYFDGGYDTDADASLKAFFKTHVTEFRSYDDYCDALSRAEILIINGKTVPEPMRSKLISVKKKLDEKGLTVLV